MDRDIFITSDTHFGHDKDFLFGPRGFSSWMEHGEAIVRNWNSIVKPGDDVWHLGDVMLSKHNETQALEWVNSLNGNIHLILGNHDTDSRISILKDACPNIVSYDYAYRMKVSGVNMFLSHFPALTSNEGHGHNIYNSIISVHGHTHQKDTFVDNICMYHAGMDSHGCFPVNIDEIVSDIKKNFA